MKKFIVLLAGGKGERFQINTGTDIPKQFYRKDQNSKNMLETTFERLYQLKTLNNCNMITLTKSLYHKYLMECNFLGSNNIVIEPDSCKNTGPAIFNLIYTISNQHGDAVVAFFPIDQEIDDKQTFLNTINKTMRLAERVKKVFLLGSPTTTIDSNFGYIIPKNDVQLEFAQDIKPVQSFVEKPTLEQLNTLNNSTVYKNMGIFIGTCSAFLEAFLEAAMQHKEGPFKGESLDTEILPYCTNNLMVAQFDGSWQDIGVVINNEKQDPTEEPSSPVNDVPNPATVEEVFQTITTTINGDFVSHKTINPQESKVENVLTE